MLPIERILVPFDWSAESKGAFQLAASIGRKYEAELIVLYVVPLSAMMYGPPPESYLNHLHEELCRLRPGEAKARVRHVLFEGDPATAILTAAAESHCDLIVIGTHARTGLKRLLSGSVAEEVVRKAPCPVLTMNRPVTTDQIDQPSPLPPSGRENHAALHPL